MSGMDLYEALAGRPDLASRVVFLTGGTANVDVEEFLRGVPNPVLEKAVDRDAILAIVEGAVGPRSRSTP